MHDHPWREPRQERSRQRFAHILDTAAALFDQHGFEAVTTNHIAEAADVPIGSLYQFFPNKEAILGALIQRYVAQLSLIFERQLTPGDSFEATVSGLVDGLFAFDAAHAGFSKLLMQINEDAAIRQIHQAVVASVMAVLAHHFPQLSEEQRHRCAQVGFGVVKGMMTLSGEPSLTPAQVQQEVRTVLVAYVHAFVAREG